jgi:sugar phosphate isomerase/epimerase
MPYEAGVQSFTYREFDLDALPGELRDTPVTAIELCDVHLAPDADEDEVTATVESFADAGIDVCGYGVVDLGPDAELDSLFAFADRLGVAYLSVDFPPSEDALALELVDRAESWGVDLAIHNHGPEATYATVSDVLDVLDRYSTDRLGACVDTGHFLRAGEAVADVIPALGDRVLALHLKDFDDDGVEVVPGAGRVDLDELAALLDTHTEFDRPLVVEYEADPENPTPAVVEAAEAVVELD